MKSIEKLGREETGGMSRRRFLARGAAFAFAAAVTGPGLTVLSGCGSNSGSGALKFWQFYGPGGEVEAQGKWFEDAVKGWNEGHETKVELQYIPVTEYLNGAKLQTAFSSGDGPDLFIISPGDFLRYYNGDVLQDLTPYINDEAKSDLYPNVMATREVDGKIFGIPMEVEPLAMYYSVKAFEDAGLSEGDIPQTWDQLLEVAGRLKKGNTFGLLFDTNPGYYQNFTWYPFMWQGGGDAVDGSGQSSAFSSKGAVQALQFWQDAIESEVAPRKALGTGANDIVANLSQGHAAIQNCGIWAVAALEANAPDFEYGTFKLPLPPGGEYTTDLGGWAFVANSKGQNPEEAGKFCAWTLASMSQQSIDRGVDWIAGADSTVAPRKSVQQQAEEQGAFEEGSMKFFREEAFPGGRGEPRYTPEVYKAVSDAIQAVQLGGQSAQDQADAAAEKIDTFLQTYDGARIV